MNVALLVQALGGLFAIMNPFVNLPMFLSLTAGYDERRQRRTAVRIGIYSLIFGVVMIFAGQAILGFFGVSVDHFRVAGGIVLMTIALGMLHGSSAAHSGTKDEQSQQQANAADSDVSFYPLTFPMIMGPGTITALIVFSGGTLANALTVLVALLIVIAVLFVVLWFAPAIGHRMSATLRVIMTRLMGMILAAIAVAMMVAGLKALLPGLA